MRANNELTLEPLLMNSCRVRGAGIIIGCRSSGGPRNGTASAARMAFLARILSAASPDLGRVCEVMC